MNLKQYKNLDEINNYLREHPEEIDKILDEIEEKQRIEKATKEINEASYQ